MPESKDSKTQRDETHYFIDSHFIVEDVHFKVPRHCFEDHSDVFSALFAEKVDSGTIDNPVYIEGVKKEEFVQLLRLIFPPSFRQSEKLSCDEWISVLKLSTIWQFPQIRTRSVTALEGMNMDALKKLECARDYNLPQWYASALTQVAEHSSLMSPREAVKIMGLEFGLKMAELHGMITAYSKAVDDFCGGGRQRRLRVSMPDIAEMRQVFISLVFSEELPDQKRKVECL